MIEPLEAELIALNCLAPMGADRSWLVTHGDLPLDGTMEMDEMVARRMGGEPLAYVLGTKWFYGRKFVVNRDVLIPRPETESLIELVKTLDLPLRPRFLDVGTGSGILGIAALLLGAKEVKGTDLDENAISAVHENMASNQIAPERFQVIQGNIIEDKNVQEWAGTGCYDIVVANILANVLVELTPVIVEQLKPGGIYITSGIIEEKEECVAEAVRAAGLEIIEVTRQGEWVSITARKS